MWELYNFSVWLGRMRSGICNHNDDHWSRRRSTIETISFSFAIFFLRQFQMLHLSQSLKQQEVHGELFPHSTYFTLHWGLLNYWYIFELTIGAHCVEQIKLKHERQSQPFPPFVHSSSSCIFFFITCQTVVVIDEISRSESITMARALCAIITHRERKRKYDTTGGQKVKPCTKWGVHVKQNTNKKKIL